MNGYKMASILLLQLFVNLFVILTESVVVENGVVSNIVIELSDDIKVSDCSDYLEKLEVRNST
jgi:hypothetical protein